MSAPLDDAALSRFVTSALARAPRLAPAAAALTAALSIACGNSGTTPKPKAACGTAKTDAAPGASASACSTGTAGDGVTCTSGTDLVAQPACQAPSGGVSSGIADRGACGDGGALAMRCLGCAPPCQVVASAGGPCQPDDAVRSQAAANCAKRCLTVHDVILGGECAAGMSNQYVVGCCP
jgi:hypothetical protein